MMKSLEETVSERRDYVNRIRESFYPGQRESSGRDVRGKFEEKEEEGEIRATSLGIRTVIAIFIFAVYV